MIYCWLRFRQDVHNPIAKKYVCVERFEVAKGWVDAEFGFVLSVWGVNRSEGGGGSVQVVKRWKIGSCVVKGELGFSDKAQLAHCLVELSGIFSPLLHKSK